MRFRKLPNAAYFLKILPHSSLPLRGLNMTCGVSLGDGRRTLFHDDGHYARFTQGLSDEVSRSGWIVLAFCWMPNQVHALIKTPEPNLCRGMQQRLRLDTARCQAN